MSSDSVVCVGFAHPDRHARSRERRSAIVVNLIATAALALSIAIAAGAVSIGRTRAVASGTHRVAASPRVPQALLVDDRPAFERKDPQDPS
jgi:hypothetical protein